MPPPPGSQKLIDGSRSPAIMLVCPEGCIKHRELTPLQSPVLYTLYARLVRVVTRVSPSDPLTLIARS
jgi:hypothetical protein